MKRIKNIDIAKALGLSTAAVSMALNDKPGVSDETRLRIYNYINEQQQEPPLYSSDDFRPASDHEAGHTKLPQKTLLLCIHKSHGAILIDKPFFSTIIEVVQTEAAKYGYSMIILHSDSNTNLAEYRNTIQSLQPAGIILMTTEMTPKDIPFYQALNVPLVLVDGYFDYLPNDSITIDNCNAIIRAYKYAYDQGHRNIGYLKSSVWISNFEHRFDGFLKARRALEAAEGKPFVLEATPSIEGSYRDMKQYLNSSKRVETFPSCFLCDLDYIAIGAIRAFKEAGYQVPDDISFIGFDDVESAIVCEPPLTTIHLQQRLLGLEAVHIMLQNINGMKNSPVDIRITSDLIVRNSVRTIVPQQK